MRCRSGWGNRAAPEISCPKMTFWLAVRAFAKNVFSLQKLQCEYWLENIRGSQSGSALFITTQREAGKCVIAPFAAKDQVLEEFV